MTRQLCNPSVSARLQLNVGRKLFEHDFYQTQTLTLLERQPICR